MTVDRLDEETTRTATGRYALRSAVALPAVAAAGAGFAVLTTLVGARWEPLLAADRSVSDAVVARVAEHRILYDVLSTVTDLGATVTLVTVLAVGVLWLLLRGQPRLAAFAAVTGAGGLILNPVVKALVGRVRPVVETPVYRTDGWSFPSGHAMSTTVCLGVLLLVFAPALAPPARRASTALVLTAVVAVGLTRIGLGVHYLTDVLAGWLLGVLWLTAAALAFHRWRVESGERDPGRLPGDVPPGDADDLRPVPAHHAPTLPHPWRGAGELAVAWVLLLGPLIGLGLLVRALGADSTGEHGVVALLAENRTRPVTTVLDVFGAVGNTLAIIAVALVAAVLAVAVARSWRPALFLTVALLGEITLFLTTAAVVDRPRPEVEHLNPDLPPTASFPSGHVAAALTLYGGIALLVWASTRARRYRLLGGALLLIPLLVAAQRLYAGAHHPADLLGSVLLATVWLGVAWWVVRPVSATPAPVQRPPRRPPRRPRG
ncbi:phosphatase PAP2 family protein [Nocardia harenae]|uniref:phosphatase PAP2 family protein n=1 Tax=Nocardia harenae TaxID=358707 RepID=UPI000A0783F5|nr:phosphatase PAP2 family protein [Nocardia harenae]